jgi:hypothetical protein
MKTCQVILSWPPSELPGDPGERKCGKPAVAWLNDFLICADCLEDYRTAGLLESVLFFAELPQDASDGE